MQKSQADISDPFVGILVQGSRYPVMYCAFNMENSTELPPNLLNIRLTSLSQKDFFAPLVVPLRLRKPSASTEDVQSKQGK